MNSTDDIKTLDKWAPTLDELEAMVCAVAALNQARADWAEANDRVGRHEDEVAMAAQAADIITKCRADSDLIAEATANERRTVRNWLQAKRDRDAAQAAISAAVAAQYAEYGEVDA